MEAQFLNLSQSADLFKLNPPGIQKLEFCRKEIELVKVTFDLINFFISILYKMIFNSKQLWDFVFVIESCVNDWKKTAWTRLDVEEMEQQCKKFSKDIRALGKSVQQWHPYVYIDQVLRNLLTSLRAITELQNPAIRDRHWLELMQSTGVSPVRK